MKRILAIILVFSSLLLISCEGKKEKSNAGTGISDAIEQIDSNIGKKTYSTELFKDYELSLVNVWATWCPPCVAEIPHLGELANEVKDKKVNIIGILLDGVDQKTGNIDAEAIAKADAILNRANAKYDIILPDETLFSSLLKNVQSIPTTFFIDKDGNVVGKAVVGAKDKAGWSKTIDEYLELI